MKLAQKSLALFSASVLLATLPACRKQSRNRLDGLVYQAEKTIKDSRDKLPEADVKAAEEALEEAKKAMSTHIPREECMK